MQFKSILIVLMSLAFVAAACDNQQQDAGADEPAAEAAETQEQAEAPAAAEAEESEEADEAEELAMVDVPEEGKLFDPAVEKEQIPEGAWFCDMGTVHYARMEQGDGTCPECHMKLKQKAADGEQKAAADEAEDDHAGHNH